LGGWISIDNTWCIDGRIFSHRSRAKEVKITGAGLDIKVESTVKLRRIAYLSFIALGLRAGLLGIGWPSMRDTFNLPLDAVGTYLIAATAGYLFTTSFSGWFIRRFGLGSFLLMGSFIAGAGFLCHTITPGWIILILVGFIASSGVAAIDAGFNTYFALNQSVGQMNVLHACFGLGGTISPILMTSAINLTGTWRWGFLPVASLYVLLGIIFVFTKKQWVKYSKAQYAAINNTLSAPKLIQSLRQPVIWMGILLFFIVTGVEGSAAQWPYTLFTQGRGEDPAIASLWMTVFWASITIGRMVFGYVADKIGQRQLLRMCCLTVVASAALIWWNPSNLVSYGALSLLGFAISPIFPVLTSITPERVGETHAANAIGFQMATARLGLSLIPGLVGVLANDYGLNLIPIIIFINALLMFTVQEFTIHTSKTLGTIHRCP
jgi:fucose permease